MGITLILTAAVFAALSNLCMRRSIDSGGTTKAFLVIQLFIAFLFVTLLNPVRTQDFSYNNALGTLGIVTGLIFGFMMLTIGRALEKGPPGLTFATWNSSTVMPAILMACIFGAQLGHEYTIWHAVGSILVVLGLFWAGWGLKGIQSFPKWVFFIGSAFILHVLFLVIMQWRALMILAPNLSPSLRIMGGSEASSQWFLPMIYFSAFLVQLFVYFKGEKRIPNSGEWLYGLFGGIANGTCTFFLIRATEAASRIENAMLFPIFSIAIILLCNTWGKFLYSEKVHWRATQVCVCGLFIGTVDWQVVREILGF